MARPVVRIAPNNPVFDLPVIVGIEEGLFAKAGLHVSFTATYADRERDTADRPVFQRLKEFDVQFATLEEEEAGVEQGDAMVAHL